MGVVFALVAWLVIIITNVNLARRKGRNPWLWGILSVITVGLAWLLTFILMALKPKEKSTVSAETADPVVVSTPVAVPTPPIAQPAVVPKVGGKLSTTGLSVAESGQLVIKDRKLSRIGWFLLANAAIVLSVSAISGGSLIAYTPYLIIFSSLYPFFSLWSSRWLAKRSHGIVIIDSNTEDEGAQALYSIVEDLVHKADLKVMPQVGIYASEEVNAFATGPTRKRSLVAFSSGLLESMDQRSVAAVAAHEISHIANGDMVTLALVQSVVNAAINVISIPLSIIQFVANFSDNVSNAMRFLIWIFRFLLTLVLVLLGSLVVKAFSRHREFKADALAARLLDRDSMVLALSELSHHHTSQLLKGQAAFAAFKIAGPKYWLDIFSTHPSTERRINALQKLDI